VKIKTLIILGILGWAYVAIYTIQELAAAAMLLRAGAYLAANLFAVWLGWKAWKEHRGRGR
jgi:hypothetical protein